MGAAQRRWLVGNAGLVTAAINVVLNAGPALLATRDRDHVPLWTMPFTGGTGVVTDTLGTLIILPFVTTILCTAAVWRDRRAGRLDRARLPERLTPLLLRPRRRAPRGAVFAVVSVALLAVPAAALLAAAAPDGLDRGPFVVYKTVLGVALGLVVTPLIAARAMADRRG